MIPPYRRIEFSLICDFPSPHKVVKRKSHLKLTVFSLTLGSYPALAAISKAVLKD